MMIVYISCGFFSLVVVFHFYFTHSLAFSCFFSLFHTKKLLWRSTNYGEIFAMRTAMISWLFGGGWQWKWRYLLSNCVCVYSESMWTLNAYILFISRYILVVFFLISFVFFRCTFHFLYLFSFIIFFFIQKLLLLLRSALFSHFLSASLWCTSLLFILLCWHILMSLGDSAAQEKPTKTLK